MYVLFRFRHLYRLRSSVREMDNQIAIVIVFYLFNPYAVNTIFAVNPVFTINTICAIFAVLTIFTVNAILTVFSVSTVSPVNTILAVFAFKPSKEILFRSLVSVIKPNLIRGFAVYTVLSVLTVVAFFALDRSKPFFIRKRFFPFRLGVDYVLRVDFFDFRRLVCRGIVATR